MIDDPVLESAKAIQEVAKTAKTGIEATQQLGGWISPIIGEPVKAVVGILSDRLQFIRWERGLRYHQRANELIEKKNLTHLRTVPPKLALPIIENAVLEENDELQDMWANLLTSAVDPNFTGAIRTAYIDILKQLEVTDVHILDFGYRELQEEVIKHNGWIRQRDHYSTEDLLTKLSIEPETVKISRHQIFDALPMELETYKTSIDNLARLGCMTPYTTGRRIEVPTKKQDWERVGQRGRVETDKVELTFSHGYETICLTSLGVGFVSACLGSQ